MGAWQCFTSLAYTFLFNNIHKKFGSSQLLIEGASKIPFHKRSSFSKYWKYFACPYFIREICLIFSLILNFLFVSIHILQTLLAQMCLVNSSEHDDLIIILWEIYFWFLWILFFCFFRSFTSIIYCTSLAIPCLCLSAMELRRSQNSYDLGAFIPKRVQ